MKVGLEIHATLNTRSKIFCSCKTNGQIPNEDVCEICLGMPGSKPKLNKEALKQAVILARALNFNLTNEIIFSRKSYFYPDLSKNYQITQFEEPLGSDGFISVSDKKIRLKRIHLEEDPAQIIRKEKTLIDYNRSGMPLAEIVTEPDIEDAAQAREFMKKLSRTLLYLNITDNVKADVNISVKESGFKRVEVKNVTGFKEIERVILYESKRQKEAVKKGEDILNATYGWDPLKGKTYLMRLKESEADYGYIYDPDLAKIIIPEEFLKQELPELSDQKISKYISQGINEDDADIIAMDPEIANLFEKVNVDSKLKAKWFRKEILRILNYNEFSLKDSKFTNKNIESTLQALEQKKINDATAKKILQELAVKDFNPTVYIKQNNLELVNNEDEINTAVDEVIIENTQAIEDYKSGSEKAFNFLFGLVMRKTKGKADPKIIKDLLNSKL
jgi:aspartyl-tRNA(Asn)/glutamyl-tRNA(Gln) amidotransferase subunit B